VDARNYIIRLFVICIAHKIIRGWAEGGINDCGMGRTWGEARNAQRFCCVNRKERKWLGDRDVDGVVWERWSSVDSFDLDGRVFGTCDRGNGFSGCLNARNFVTLLWHCLLASHEHQRFTDLAGRLYDSYYQQRRPVPVAAPSKT
jgi:hypothetical protein